MLLSGMLFNHWSSVLLFVWETICLLPWIPEHLDQNVAVECQRFSKMVSFPRRLTADRSASQSGEVPGVFSAGLPLQDAGRCYHLLLLNEFNWKWVSSTYNCSVIGTIFNHVNCCFFHLLSDNCADYSISSDRYACKQSTYTHSHGRSIQQCQYNYLFCSSSEITLTSSFQSIVI